MVFSLRADFQLIMGFEDVGAAFILSNASRRLSQPSRMRAAIASQTFFKVYGKPRKDLLSLTFSNTTVKRRPRYHAVVPQRLYFIRQDSTAFSAILNHSWSTTSTSSHHCTIENASNLQKMLV